VFEAANNVSRGEYFAALRNLRPLQAREKEVFAMPGTRWAGVEHDPRAERPAEPAAPAEKLRQSA